MDLLDDYKEFLDSKTEYSSEEKLLILKLLNKYYIENKKNISISILQELEKIVLKNNEKYIGKLFCPTNKYVIGTLIADLSLIKKELWVLLSVLTRLKIFKRQRINNHKNFRKGFYIDELENKINNDGIILLRDFLDNNLHFKIVNELSNQPLALNKEISSNIRYSLPILKNFNIFPKRLRASSKALPKIASLISKLGFVDNYWQAKKLVYSNTFCQKILINTKKDDLQKDSHMDTFFPSLKFWYFPLDVNSNKAFKFSYGSNKYSVSRMRFESQKISEISRQHQYADPNKKLLTSQQSDLQGSLRYSDLELNKLGLTIDPVPVKANTLVLADVSGVHSRGLGEDQVDKSLRLALHGNARHLNIF